MTVGRSIQITAFPRDDAAFRAHIDAARSASGDWGSPRAIEAAIRVAYPRAIVRRANQLAAMTAIDTWYAYRDGAIRPGEDGGEWWLNPDLPQATVSRAGDYIDATDSTAELFGVPREAIAGAPAGTFSRHEGGPEVGRRLFEVLAATGTLHSTAVIVRPNAEEWPVEFHMRPAGDSRYTVVYRRI